MKPKISIVDIKEASPKQPRRRIVLRVQYGDKSARLNIALPDDDRLSPAEASRLEIHELTTALEKWCSDPSEEVGELRKRAAS